MRMKKIDKFINLILPLITLACILLLWSVGAIVVGSEYILPSVKTTLKEFVCLFKNKNFYTALSFSLLRSAVAFFVSFVPSAILAYLASKSKTADKLILPFISIVRALPTLAIILLVLFWTNNDRQVTPIVVTMLVVMPTVYTNLRTALDGIDKTTIDAGKVDGAGKKQLFFYIELPQIAPPLFNVIGSGLSLNLKLMVAAEVISATAKSLGAMLNNSSYNAEIITMLALVVVILIIGLLIEFVFNKLSQKVGEWR